jgi:molecular chaperone GrpE
MNLNFLKKKNMQKQEENNSVQDEIKNKNEEGQVPETSEEQSLPDAENAEESPEAKLEIELSVARDKYLRLYSDFENYKKRIARDRIESAKMAGADIFLSILPVMDDMERAVKAMREDGDTTEAMKEGLILIHTKLKAITEAKGLKAMESTGKLFDPELHDAITNIPAAEDMKGKVIEEIEKGYYLNDKVIRHAKVIVGS